MTDPAQGQIEISEIRKAEPVVVFESGLGSYKEVWNKVLPVVASTNVFAYNRPGIPRSPDTSRPRDAATIEEELTAPLRKRNLQPPFVLVGHSACGLYVSDVGSEQAKLRKIKRERGFGELIAEPHAIFDPVGPRFLADPKSRTRFERLTIRL